jgi:hypothetical protein
MIKLGIEGNIVIRKDSNYFCLLDVQKRSVLKKGRFGYDGS